MMLKEFKMISLIYYQLFNIITRVLWWININSQIYVESYYGVATRDILYLDLKTFRLVYNINGLYVHIFDYIVIREKSQINYWKSNYGIVFGKLFVRA